MFVDTRDERSALLQKCMGDFELFCKVLVWILDKSSVRTTLKFNEIQRKQNARRTWRDVALKPRQIGFTTLELARDVWKLLQPNQRVLVICQTDKDSTQLKKFSSDVERILDGLASAGLELNFRERSLGRWALAHRDSTLQIIESGASEQAAVKKGRGGTLSRVHSTECAFYEHPELTLNALLESVPMLPGTEVIFESTPNGVGNYFHNLYVNAEAGRNGYKAHFFGWYDDSAYRLPLFDGEIITPQNAREQELVDLHNITQEQLKWYRAKVSLKGQDEVDQEYASDPVRTFLTSGRSFFDMGRLNEMSARATSPTETPREDLRIWCTPRHQAEYVIGVDPAEGLGEDGDWSVASVWERRTCQHVATLQNKMQANPFAEQVHALATQQHDAEIIIERNKGMALLSALDRLKCKNIYYDGNDKPGFATTEASRAMILEDLANAVRDGSCITPDPAAIAELRSFVIDQKTGRPYAPTKKKKNGIGDDFIFSAALAWHRLIAPRTEVHDTEPMGRRDFGGDDAWGGAHGF